MSSQYNYKHFVLVTNALDLGDDILFFTAQVTQTDIHKNLKVKQIPFDEIYSIKSEEISFYCYDPLYCDEKIENNILKTAALYNEATHGPLQEG